MTKKFYTLSTVEAATMVAVNAFNKNPETTLFITSERTIQYVRSNTNTNWHKNIITPDRFDFIHCKNLTYTTIILNDYISYIKDWAIYSLIMSMDQIENVLIYDGEYDRYYELHSFGISVISSLKKKTTCFKDFVIPKEINKIFCELYYSFLTDSDITFVHDYK